MALFSVKNYVNSFICAVNKLCKIRLMEVFKITHEDNYKKVNPEDYILSVLSPEDKLDAAFKIAGEAFKKSKLTVKDIEDAVKTIRRKAYEEKK